MAKLNPSIGGITVIVALAMLIIACSPKFDWREVRGEAAPYTILMPDKPSQRTRTILLGEQNVTMHMSYTQIDGVKFAVGSINMPDATRAQTAVTLIKTALLNNINGQLIQEKSRVVNQHGNLLFNLDLEAVGNSASANSSQTIHLFGRIVAWNTWVFQIVVIGPQQNIEQDSVSTFLDSFSLSR